MKHYAHTDMTRTAGSLTVGEVVSDDQAFDRITVEQINAPSMRENGHELTEPHVTFLGTREVAGDRVVRCWPADARVVISSTTKSPATHEG